MTHATEEGHKGDLLIVAGHHVGEGEQIAEILEVLGTPGQPPLLRPLGRRPREHPLSRRRRDLRPARKRASAAKRVIRARICRPHRRQDRRVAARAEDACGRQRPGVTARAAPAGFR